MLSLYAVLIGFLLDMLFGDPDFKLHPIRVIGMLIKKTETVIRQVFPKNKMWELLGGTLMTIFVCFICFASVFIFLKYAYHFNIFFGLICESIFCWLFTATKSLKTESMKVYSQLKKGNIEGARKAVSMIVGRDTERLDEDGIIKAAVETVAENTSDGVIATLIYIFIGGAPLGALYKAVNTMDSMVGYKNEKYLYFGRCSARLDDVLNFIPSRISAIMMIAAAGMAGMDFKGAVRIFRRDRLKHKSPNSAQTEAACAGALGIRLAGDAWYFGKLYKKDYIGDPIKPIKCENILEVNKLMYISAFISIVLFTSLKLIILGGM